MKLKEFLSCVGVNDEIYLFSNSLAVEHGTAFSLMQLPKAFLEYDVSCIRSIASLKPESRFAIFVYFEGIDKFGGNDNE